MNSFITILKEQINSFYLVRRLALFEVKIANRNQYLGVLWEVIQPGIQIVIYWFVFGFGIHSTTGRGDIFYLDRTIPYFPWLLTGISVWFFIHQAIPLSAKSIYTRIGIISKMSFPMSVVPTVVIISKLYQHLMLLAVIMVVCQMIGYPISIYYLQLPYFMFATVIFLVALALVLSTLTTIVRDIQSVVTAVVRILIYLTPILWPPYDLKPGIILDILKLNPFFYLVEGYRSSLLGVSWYAVEHWRYTVYFWCATVLLLAIGSYLHLKFRNRFVDFI